MKQAILFLCTGNSCRSQMAEGWAGHLLSDRFDVYSAGIEKHSLNPLAVKVMAEAGVDISGYFSKLIEELPVREFDYVVTVCDNAHESCPIFPGQAVIIHHSFADPPRLAADAATEADALVHYRRVRDEIQAFIKSLPATLKNMEC
ncbi:MAG: arsenate reductase ArsC [Deltaproteobacteria bacterium]|nr:arsenate reductase ArsC [Deltaproteobacteria bacterium]